MIFNKLFGKVNSSSSQPLSHISGFQTRSSSLLNNSSVRSSKVPQISSHSWNAMDHSGERGVATVSSPSISGITLRNFSSLESRPLTTTIDMHEILFPYLQSPIAKIIVEENNVKKNSFLKLLEDNNIPVYYMHSTPLVKSDDIKKTLEVLQKDKVLTQGVTLWKKDEIFFEIYWRKALNLDEVVQEISSKSTPTAATHLVNYCSQKCIEYVNKVMGDPDAKVEYFGLVLPKR